MSQAWLNRCDIKYCKNNVLINNQNTSVHPTPRSPELFQKWEKEVSRTGMKLPRTARICERHFDPEDVVEFGCSKKEKGSSKAEIIKMRVLVKGAVPKRFDDEIAEYLKQKDLQNNDRETIVVDTEKIPPPQKRPRTKIKFVPNNNTVAAQQQNVVIAPKFKSAEELLFEKIYTGQIEPRLPSKSWNIHHCQLPEKGFVFSEIAALLADNSIPPLFKKSVFFDGNFNIRVYLNGKYFPNVEFDRPKTIRDVEELIGNVNAIKICEGGPPLTETATLHFACRDERMFRWRHINCELRLKRGRICKNCSILCRNINLSNSNKEKSKETGKRKKHNECEGKKECEYCEYEILEE